MEWQDIETAPKDGRLIDLYCVAEKPETEEIIYTRLCDCSWQEADAIFPWTGWVRTTDDGNIDAVETPATSPIGLPPWTPTHWMAIPNINHGWETIEAAPQDGRNILTWDGNDQEVLFFSQHGHGWTNGNPKVKYNPTHWMPLPKPPTLKQEGEK